MILHRARALIDPDTLWAKLVYLLYFGAGAALLPYLVLYYESLGFSGRQIGVLAALPPAITLFAASLWGGLADASGRHRLLFTVTMAGTLLAVVAMPLLASFSGLITAVVAFAFFASPVMPFIDRTVIDMLAKRRGDYGKQRLWGTVGWGLVAPLVGELSERAGLEWIFTVYLALMAATLLAGLRLPLERATMNAPFWRSLRLLAGNRELLLFLLAVFVGGAGLAVMNNYLFLYLSDLGAGKGLMGFSLTVATLSEMPVLFFSGRLLERWRPTGLLVVSLLAYAARAFAYSIMGTPELVLPIQLLHGLTFALMWAAGVTYMARVAPAGMETTAQGLFGGVMIGLGGAAGGFFGGFLYDATGPVVMFRLASLAALATALLVRFVSNMGTNNKRA